MRSVNRWRIGQTICLYFESYSGITAGLSAVELGDVSPPAGERTLREEFSRLVVAFGGCADVGFGGLYCLTQRVTHYHLGVSVHDRDSASNCTEAMQPFLGRAAATR